MNGDDIAALARAILYEGYRLYPYRRTALKNQQRWNFGVLFPPDYCANQDRSAHSLGQTECLLEGSADSSLAVTIRFLQQLDSDHTIEREIVTGPLRLDCLLARGAVFPFCLENKLEGCIEVTANQGGPGIFKLTVRIKNESAFLGGDRDKALQSAFISTHALLAIHHGRFHSLIDPPEALRQLAAGCKNIGMWPVLVGTDGTGDRMLSCAIILYDYPKISCQSPGDLFDATEIDEMLTLRMRTLAEPEKEELRAEPTVIRSVLERSDELSAQQFNALHASMRVERTTGCPYRQGDRVRLRPSGRADIFDLALAGETATVVSVEQNAEGQFYVSVVVETDPGKDLGLEGKPGHRFFFRAEEVERL